MKRGNPSGLGQIRGKEFSAVNSVRNIIEDEISDLNHLIKVLGRSIEKFEAAYRKRDHREFNILKRQVFEIQKRIHSLIR